MYVVYQYDNVNLMSLGSVLYVDFDKWPCRRVEFEAKSSRNLLIPGTVSRQQEVGWEK